MKESDASRPTDEVVSSALRPIRSTRLWCNGWMGRKATSLVSYLVRSTTPSRPPTARSRSLLVASRCASPVAVRMRHDCVQLYVVRMRHGRTNHTHERKQSSAPSHSCESGGTDRSDIHRIVISASVGKRGDRSIVNSTIAGSGTTALSFGAAGSPPSRRSSGLRSARCPSGSSPAGTTRPTTTNAHR